MKAMVIEQYGSADVLQYREVESPKIKPSELLVKVHATSVNPLENESSARNVEMVDE